MGLDDEIEKVNEVRVKYQMKYQKKTVRRRSRVELNDVDVER